MKEVSGTGREQVNPSVKPGFRFLFREALPSPFSLVLGPFLNNALHASIGRLSTRALLFRRSLSTSDWFLPSSIRAPDVAHRRLLELRPEVT
jgi:hypothetical protein